MSTSQKSNPSKSRALGAKLIYETFKILVENQGGLSIRQIHEELEKRVELDDWAKGIYEKSQYVRWHSVLHFHSIPCVKAGFLIKKNGIWHLTDEGEKALKLGEEKLIAEAINSYKKWKNAKLDSGDADIINSDDEDEDIAQFDTTIELVQQKALDGIKRFIDKMNPYEFQDLVAALLRGMGYYTPFVAPRGKDNGIDIRAYRDPLGIESPRIKVQVKHRQNPSSVQEIRQLTGILQKDGDVGIFISSGGFTADAKTFAASSHVHIELIDLETFIGLWQEFFAKLNDEDKAILPLAPIYFLAPKE